MPNSSSHRASRRQAQVARVLQISSKVARRLNAHKGDRELFFDSTLTKK